MSEEPLPSLPTRQHDPPSTDAPTLGMPATAAPVVDLPGYEILGELGRGGMGVVYKARQIKLNRIVAVKMILAGTHASAEAIARFHHEAFTVARLQHPNIVQIHEVGNHGGHSYLVLEYVEGGTLSKRTAGVPQAPREAARLVETLARAVAFAHEHGIVHRDLKPGNVLLTTDGVPRITDFGLATEIHRQENHLTATGAVVGTPGYMSPEQAGDRGIPVGPAADVWAMGAILYALLTGRPPFQASTPVETILQTLTDDPGPPSRLSKKVPRDLDTVCLKCLRKEPAQRYRSAGELADDLRRFLADEPIKARPISRSERTWRWCRRNPRSAALTATVAVLLLTVAVVSTAAALWLGAALHDAQTQRQRAKLAEREQRRKVYDGHVTEAKFRRHSRLQGQRFGSLDAIRAALQLLPQLGLADAEVQNQRQILRDLAISCLTLPDVRVAGEWEGWPEGSFSFDLDDRGEWYARSDVRGNVTVRRTRDDGEVYGLAGDGKRAWVAFAPNTRTLVVWRADNSIEGHSLPDGRVTFAFRLRDSAEPASVRISHDGRTFAAALGDGTVTLHSLPEGTVLRREKLVSPERVSMELSPDGEHLAVVCGTYQNPFSLAQLGAEQRLHSRSVVRVFEVRSQQPPRLLHHADVITNLAWYPDSRTLAAGGTNLANEIFVWDVPSGKKLAEITSQKGGDPHLSLNRTGDLLMSWGAWGGGIKVWHPHTQQELLTLPRAWNHFSWLAADGRLFAREIHGTKLRLLECVPGQVHRAFVRDLRGEKGKMFHRPSLHPGGRLLATSMEGGVALWDLPSGREVAFLPINDVSTVRFDSSGAMWTYGSKGTLRWPVRLSEDRATQVGPPQTISAVSTFGVNMDLSRDGGVVAGAVASQPVMVFHRNRPGEVVRLFPRTDVRDLAVSPDGRFVVTPTADGKPRGFTVWDADSGKVVTTLLPDEGGGRACFTADGRWLVINSHWLEVGTWKEGPLVEGFTISGGCMSDDGKLLATYSGEEGTRLFDRASGRLLARLATPGQGRIESIVLSPDGTRLIGIDRDNLFVHVWDLRKLRADLRALGLDWDAPEYPAEAEPSREPLPVEVYLGDLEDDAAIGPRPSVEHLRHLIGVNSLILAFQPLNYKAYRQRGRAHAMLNDQRSAIADYSMALNVLPAEDPSRLDLLSRRAGNYLILGDEERAFADLRQAERFDAGRVATLRTLHASGLTRRARNVAEKHVHARLLRSAVRCDGAYAPARNDLAWRLLLTAGNKEETAEALTHARRAVAQAPSQGAYLNTLGLALYRNGLIDEAIGVLEKSLTASRAGSQCYDLFFLAMCHAKRGDRPRAEDYLRRATEETAKEKTLPARSLEELKRFRGEAEAEVKKTAGM